MRIAQSTVKCGATHTDHYGNQTKQEEKQAGIPAANIYRERETEAEIQGVSYRAKRNYIDWKSCSNSLTIFDNILTLSVGYRALN